MFKESVTRNRLRLTKTWRNIRTGYTRLTILREWYVSKWINNLLTCRSSLSVLDLGCGYGHHSVKIAHTHPDIKVFCVDQDAKFCESIRYAKKNFSLENLSVQSNTIEEYDSDKLFDIVIMITVLQFFQNQVKILKKIRRMMSDKARLLIYLPLKPQFGSKMRKILRIPLEDQNQFLCTAGDFFKNLKCAGLAIEKYKYTYGVWGAFSFSIFYAFRHKKPLK